MTFTEQQNAELGGVDSPLTRLREPFPENQISKLPKPTKPQNEAVKSDYKQGVRCKICKGWHHPEVIHLDYVGHAAITDRLLDVDLGWNWEPLAFDEHGLPALDRNGGLWIKLTVLGITRMGYGSADGKQGGDAIKELIGDALRNAAMRFGAALDLWHKGDLHGDEAQGNNTPDTGSESVPEQSIDPNSPPDATITDEQRDEITVMAQGAGVELAKICKAADIQSLTELPANKFEGTINRLKLTMAKNAKQKEAA